MSLAQRTFSSLSIPAYRRFFAGNVASLFGFWVRIVVQGWLVYEITDSEAWLGIVTAVGLLPLVLFGPVGGVLADRIDRRRVLLTVPLVSVAANVVLGVLVLNDAILVGHIMAASVVIGSARAVEIPVRNAMVRDIVGLPDLPNAVALNAAGFNVARVAGPALGAVLLPVLGSGPYLGAGPCFLLAAGLNLGMVVAAATLKDVPTTARAAPGSPLRQLLEGVAYVRGHTRTRLLITMLAITMIFTWTYQSLMPAYAKSRLGLGPEGYSLLMATIGLGALLGALWVAGRAGGTGSQRNAVFGLVWAGALCVFALGFVRDPRLAFPILLVTGACQVGFFATANGLVQQSVPDPLRGRVMGLWSLTFGASFPIGSLIMGGVSEAFGIPWAWSGGAVVMVLLTLVLWFRLPPRQ